MYIYICIYINPLWARAGGVHLAAAGAGRRPAAARHLLRLLLRGGTLQHHL